MNQETKDKASDCLQELFKACLDVINEVAVRADKGQTPTEAEVRLSESFAALGIQMVALVAQQEKEGK